MARDFFAEFQDYRQRLLASEDADLAAPPPPVQPAPTEGSTERPRVTGEVSTGGRGINAYLADLLEQS